MYSSSFRLTNRDIDLAFEAGHLFLIFQPRIELATGRVLGAEAYVRWNHPDYGLMPPGLFLAFFERRGRSGDLTRFVASAAADAMAEWQARGQDWPVSINLSAGDITDAALPGVLNALFDERGLEPCRFTLEVPEGAFARHGEAAVLAIGEFRRLGFRTALDGGGAVIVPAQFVTPEHFDEIKISGSAIIQFARRLQHAGLGFIGKRVAQAAGQGLAATAVGVEDETTLLALAPLGFTAAQGAHICRPRPAAELAGWSYMLRTQIETGAGASLPAAEAATEGGGEQADEEMLLVQQLDDMPGQFARRVPAAMPGEIELHYEELALAIPGIDAPVCAAALDPVCFFPDRRLVALLRRPPRHGRRLPGIERPIRMRVRRPKPKPKKKSLFERALSSLWPAKRAPAR